MALIKCPECGRGVSDTASECPGCTYTWQSPAPEKPFPPASQHTHGKWVWISLAGAALLSIAAVGSLTRHRFLAPQFPTSQREAAQDFWDTVVDQYVKVGLIVRYEPQPDRLVMYVRRPQWRLLSLEDKKAFLANLSKSNEILGRPRHVEIRDGDSGNVFGSARRAEKNDIYE
jgi:hypothetical protein